MGKEIITRCGYRCDLCLAYIKNIEKEDLRKELSDGWEKCYGFRTPVEKIYCEGCLTRDSPKLIDNECPVRPCVMNKGIENCSQCDEYPCEKYEQREVVYEEIVKKGKKISKIERKLYIKPYENKTRIKDLRAKNYPNGKMINKILKPTLDDMVRFIQKDDQRNIFDTLINYIRTAYEIEETINYGMGWNIRYHSGNNTIVRLFPETSGFSVLIVYGRKEIDNYLKIQDKLSKEIKKIVRNTTQFHDGKWIWIRIQHEKTLDECKKLISIKRRVKVK